MTREELYDHTLEVLDKLPALEFDYYMDIERCMKQKELLNTYLHLLYQCREEGDGHVESHVNEVELEVRTDSGIHEARASKHYLYLRNVENNSRADMGTVSTAIERMLTYGKRLEEHMVFLKEQVEVEKVGLLYKPV